MTTYAAGGYVAASPEPAPLRSGPATPTMVADQLDALLGEHLMPLRVRRAGMDEPHLLAVDASGQPVVVEIVALLDEDAAIRALRHAGRAAQMSTHDLARAYSGGSDRYASHLAAFRLTVPATALLSTLVRGGSRLLLVCSHISPGMDDVLEFLLQPGWQVDVLRAEVVTEPDGNRTVELSPVTRSAAPQRSLETPQWAHSPETYAASFDPTPLYRARAERSLFAREEPDGLIDTESGWVANRSAAQPVREPERSDWPRRPDTSDWPSLPDTSDWPSLPEVSDWPVRTESRSWLAAEPVEPARTPAPRPAPVVVPPEFAVPLAELGSNEPDPLLAAVGAALGGPAVLVWCPRGAAECFEALLHTDGMIELADGSQYLDVETATRAVSGFAGPLDAWQVWHVDSPTGPTLAEFASRSYPGQF